MSKPNRHNLSNPLEFACALLAGKWKVSVLWHLRKGVLRFGEIKREIPQVSQKVLTQTLRQLEKDGLIDRKAFPEVPPRVEYSLTRFGIELQPTLDHLYEWGKKHIRHNQN